MRQKNTVGGGAQTNANGLHFEQTSELRDLLSNHPSYSLNGDELIDKKTGKTVATLYQKHSLYRNFLEPRGIDYTQRISKKLLPDDALFVDKINTLFIIEKKFQSGAGSVDEKLQTCDFKKKQYEKLVPKGVKVEYCYFLCEWFERDEYRDVKDYIESVGCRYFFDSIPMSYFGL